jgi:cell division protein FtsW
MKLASVVLFLCTIVLMGLGIVILTSVGNVQGARLFADPNHFWRQQLVFAAVSLAGCLAVMCIPPSFLFDRRVAIGIVAIVLVSLVAVHVPHLGYRANGSTRWIRLGGFLLQPSEFVKLAAIVLSAWWLGAPERRNAAFWEGFAVPVIGMGVIVVGFLSQPDLGSSIMLVLVNGLVLFLAGARWRHLVPAAILGAVLVALFLAHDPVRMRRLSPRAQAFLRPLVVLVGRGDAAKDDALRPAADDDSYQVDMALSALGAGGWRGRGLGESIYKHRYLPENHTDFIFAMVGEELGLAATLSCVLLFLAMAAAGFYIAWRAPDRRTMLLAAGMTLQIVLAAAVNIAVVTDAAPTKGLALPFLSYGGSSLIASVATVGFILAVGVRGPAPERPAREAPPPPSHRISSDLWNG